MAEEVRLARQRLGLSQEQLAARIDASTESISNIERGRTTPSLAMFARLARELSLDAPAIPNVAGNPRDARSDRIRTEVQASALMQRLSDDELQLWLRLGTAIQDHGGSA